MATNYPGALDLLTNPLATDQMDNPPHATQHADANDAIEAIQLELGTDPAGVDTDVKTRLTNIETEKVASTTIDDIVTLTQAAYDAIGTPVATTLYVIVEG